MCQKYSEKNPSSCRSTYGRYEKEITFSESLKIIIPESGEWLKNLTPLEKEIGALTWDIDVSVRDEGAGLRICAPSMRISRSLGKGYRAFQTEITAISDCARILLE